MKVKNYVQIDLIKCIACVLVIINHTCSYINSNRFFFLSELVLCRIAVPLFIMCTGFLTYNKKIDLKYTLRKIFRVFIPLLIFSLLIFILREKKFSLLFFIEIFQNPIIEQYWYLYMIIGLYIMQPYLNKICDSLKLKDFIILIIMTLILPSLNSNLSPYFFQTNFTYIVGFYIVGSFLRKIIDLKQFDLKSVQFFSLIIFIIGYITGIFLYNENNIAIYNCDGIIVIILAISFACVLINYNFPKKWNDLLNKISSATFGVYLLHPILQNKFYDLGIIQKLLNFSEIIGIITLQFSLILTCFILIFLFTFFKNNLKRIVAKINFSRDSKIVEI